MIVGKIEQLTRVVGHPVRGFRRDWQMVTSASERLTKIELAWRDLLEIERKIAANENQYALNRELEEEQNRITMRLHTLITGEDGQTNIGCLR